MQLGSSITPQHCSRTSIHSGQGYTVGQRYTVVACQFEPAPTSWIPRVDVSTIERWENEIMRVELLRYELILAAEMLNSDLIQPSHILAAEVSPILLRNVD
ncbi:hypothetical protein GOP47_0029844 [Adiantum capillus-veneris]|nr:hypothetical protein GOP47_0029844 [Adiantum capillus-veneris]